MFSYSDGLILIHNIVSYMSLSVLHYGFCLELAKFHGIWEVVRVKQSISKLPQSKRVQLMSRLLRNEFPWLTDWNDEETLRRQSWSRWEPVLLSASQTQPKTWLLHCPACLPWQSSTNTFTKENNHMSLQHLIRPSGLEGSTCRLSRGLHTGESQLMPSLCVWGAGGGAQAHLSIFTVLTKYIIHCHLLSGRMHRALVLQN